MQNLEAGGSGISSDIRWECERMATKKNERKTALRGWMDEQYRIQAGLRKRVEALVAEMSIEQDLIALREDRGLSQRALARLVGMKQPVIARIESGKTRNLELKTVVRIATALGAKVRIELEANGARDRRKKVSRRLAKTA
jgi:ribosome-binding protein aMBF1 (putative translation factor)